MRKLQMIDDADGIWYEMSEMDVRCLSTELFYTIDYRPEQYPEYDELKNALDAWLSAKP